MSDRPLLNKRWQLLERLGGGAQGHTYLATDTQATSERIVVVKQLTLGSKGNATWKKFDLFEREVRVLRELSHPAIPRFLDQFESEPGVFNLVMERAPGRPLSTPGLELTEEDLTKILRDTLEVLGYLHALKPPVIHRDLKPANMVRSDDGIVSLVDFGGVRAAVREKGGSTVVGTFGYMAPEQLHGQATAATDLFGLGATIVALAGGLEPEDVPRNGLRMNLREHLKTVDRKLVTVLEWMTCPDPDERPQSAAEVLTRLGPEAAQVDKAVAAITPAAPADQSGEDLVTVDRTLEQTNEFLDTLPKPLAKVLRILMFIIGVSGYLGFTIVRVALLPLVFGIISACSSEKFNAKLQESRKTARKAVDECRDGFKEITGMASKPKRLAGKTDDKSGKHDDKSDAPGTTPG